MRSVSCRVTVAGTGAPGSDYRGIDKKRNEQSTSKDVTRPTFCPSSLAALKQTGQWNLMG